MSKTKIDFHEVVNVVRKADVPKGWEVKLPSFLRAAAPVYQAELKYLDWMSKVNSKFVTGTLVGAGSTKNIAAGIPTGIASAGKALVNYDYTKARQDVKHAKDTGTVYVSNPVYGVVQLMRQTPDSIVKEVGKIINKELDDFRGGVIFGRPVISGDIFNIRSTVEPSDEDTRKSNE